MRNCLLGIDIGTSGCKCTVIDDNGAMIAEASSGYGTAALNPGWSEQRPDDWYSALIFSLRSISRNDAYAIRDIRAVGLTGQMRGITLIGDTGTVIRDSVLWNDNRCETEVREILDKHADLIRSVTRNPLNTMCSLPKLLWIMKHEPEIWRSARAMIYPKDYIAYRLTGSLHTDHSDASGSSLYDLTKRTWSQEILDLFSIPLKKLPAIVSSTSVVGGLTSRAAKETGLLESVPVVAGGSDAVAELFAAGVRTPRQCKIRLGSSGAISTAVRSLDDSGASRHYCWSYIEPDTWMIDINTRSCAQAVEWLCGVFYNFERGEGDRSLLYSIMEKEASSISAGSEGLVFHPYLMGEDAPYWNTDLRASFWGITSRHTRAHFSRAILEGTAYALRDARSAMGKNAEQFEEYLFVGGGIKNRLWVSIVADVLGVDAVISLNASASAGAAMLAGIGAGVFADHEDALKRCTRRAERVHYRQENNSLYARLFERYIEIKRTLDSLY